jgi:hypothetical protein
MATRPRPHRRGFSLGTFSAPRGLISYGPFCPLPGGWSQADEAEPRAIPLVRVFRREDLHRFGTFFWLRLAVMAVLPLERRNNGT